MIMALVSNGVTLYEYRPFSHTTTTNVGPTAVGIEPRPDVVDFCGKTVPSIRLNVLDRKARPVFLEDGNDGFRFATLTVLDLNRNRPLALIRLCEF